MTCTSVCKIMPVYSRTTTWSYEWCESFFLCYFIAPSYPHVSEKQPHLSFALRSFPEHQMIILVAVTPSVKCPTQPAPTSCWVRERGSNLSGSQPSTSSSEIGRAVWGKSCLHSRQHFLLVYSPEVNTEALANTTPGGIQYLYTACWWRSLCLLPCHLLSYLFVLSLL